MALVRFKMLHGPLSEVGIEVKKLTDGYATTS